MGILHFFNLLAQRTIEPFGHANSKRVVIALSHPLTTDHPAEPSVRELREKANNIQVLVVNELLARGLPAATHQVQQFLSVS